MKVLEEMNLTELKAMLKKVQKGVMDCSRRRVEAKINGLIKRLSSS